MGMFNKLKNKTKELLKLHVAGATVRHKGRFSDLKVFENSEPLDNEFIGKYVAPFYMGSKETEEFRKAYLCLRESINIDLVSKLLGDFNWRSRSVGAYFAGLEGMGELEENIGRLLLRSDVCYAGHDYCLALASFSTPSATQFLHQYLEYYLEQTDLWFEQSSAMAALSYIGKKNSEDLLESHMAAWDKFIESKPNWNLGDSIEGFNSQMQSLNEFKYKSAANKALKFVLRTGRGKALRPLA